MKQSLQKSENLSLVQSDARAYDSGTEDKAANLRESFDNWPNSVASTLVQSSVPQDQPSLIERLRRGPLTLTEVTRVNFATIREGTEHRHWPAEVVLSFLVADVIKRQQK
jgi:hypothetical protein